MLALVYALLVEGRSRDDVDRLNADLGISAVQSKVTPNSKADRAAELADLEALAGGE